MNADAPSFLPHIEEDASSLVSDAFHRHLDLFSTVAAQAAEYLAGETLAVYPDQHRFIGGYVPHHQCNVFIRVNIASVGDGGEIAVRRRQLGFGHTVHQPVVAKSVGDEVRQGHDFNPESRGHSFKLGQPGHRAVFFQNLADDSARIEAGHSGQVNDGFSMSCPCQDAALSGAQREHVSRPDNILGLRGGVEHGLYRLGAVGCGDAGAHFVLGFDGHGERGSELGCIMIHHHGYLQLVKTLAGDRQADKPAAMSGHEVNSIGGYLLRRHGQVALVLPVLIVDYDKALAGFDVFNCFWNRGQTGAHFHSTDLLSDSETVLNQKFRGQTAGLWLGELRHILGDDIHLKVHHVAFFPAAQGGILARIFNHGDPE